MTSVDVRADASKRQADRIKLWCSDESGTVKASRSQKHMSGVGVEAEIGLGTQGKPSLSYLCISPLSLSVFMTYSVSPRPHGQKNQRPTGLAEHHQWYLLRDSVVT